MTKSTQHAKRAHGPEQVQWTIHIFEQEANGDEIKKYAERPRDSIVGIAFGPHNVLDGNLTNRSAIPGGERGNEPV